MSQFKIYLTLSASPRNIAEMSYKTIYTELPWFGRHNDPSNKSQILSRNLFFNQFVHHGIELFADGSTTLSFAGCNFPSELLFWRSRERNWKLQSIENQLNFVSSSFWFGNFIISTFNWKICFSLPDWTHSMLNFKHSLSS